MTNTFELNGITYITDHETVSVLRSIIPPAKATSDSSAVIAVIELGLLTGRIQKAQREGWPGKPDHQFPNPKTLPRQHQQRHCKQGDAAGGADHKRF